MIFFKVTKKVMLLSRFIAEFNVGITKKTSFVPLRSVSVIVCPCVVLLCVERLIMTRFRLVCLTSLVKLMNSSE